MNKENYNDKKEFDFLVYVKNLEMSVKLFILDWVIFILVCSMLIAINLPPKIWNEEEIKLYHSRDRMLDLAYALKCFHILTGEYTNDKSLIVNTIMNVRDSLIANENLYGKKYIYMDCTFEGEFIKSNKSISERIIDLSPVNKNRRLFYLDSIIWEERKGWTTNDSLRMWSISNIEDLKNLPDAVTLNVTDHSTDKKIFKNPSFEILDSLYSDSNFIGFINRYDCGDIIYVDIPIGFGHMLDTLFSESTIIPKEVADTIYTLEEPIDGEIDSYQRNYVKNNFLFNYVPKGEYLNLWQSGRGLDSLYLNNDISDTTYKITFIDEDYDEVVVQTSNSFILKYLDKILLDSIKVHMNLSENEMLSEKDSFTETDEETSDDLNDIDWLELLAMVDELKRDLKTEVEFGDTLKVQYSFKIRKISNIEIINRRINVEDYDRKRYDISYNNLLCPITNQEFIIDIDYSDIDNPYYTIVSPTNEYYSERRYVFFKFQPGNPGMIKDDEVSWRFKPKWNFPLK